MSVLHAVWSADDRLCIWGESALRGDRLPFPRGRAPADGRPRRHPYGLGAAEIRASLIDLADGNGPRNTTASEIVVCLPSSVRSPLPSPHLPGGVTATAGTTTRTQTEAAAGTAWRVDAVRLDPVDAIDLLLGLPVRTPVTARLSPSMTAIAQLATFALHAVAAGRVAPALLQHGGTWQARWVPVLTNQDRDHLRAVAQRLSPAAIAVAGEQSRTSGAVVREAVEQFVDAAARGALARRRLVSGRDSRSKRTSEDAATRAWLVALTSDDPIVRGSPDALAGLAQRLDTWRRSATTAGPLRTAFRLVPPAPDPEVADTDQPWYLDFVLQATDDPSLQVPAAEVWQAGRTLTFLERTLEHPQERLLTDLGRATRLYPELEAALHVARPERAELDTPGVMSFLRDAAPVLEQAGYGVLLPAELRHPARLAARLKTTSKTGGDGAAAPGLLGRDAIVDYRWEIAVGDGALGADELRELARLKAPLVRLRGRWVELREGDLDAAIRLLEQGHDGGGPSGDMGIAEAARIGLGIGDPGVGLPVDGVDADGPLAALLGDDVDHHLEQLATPAGFAGELRPYQARGLAWLAFLGSLGLGGCLADDMGLGKTPQLLALLLHERGGVTRRSKRWPGPTLLVCPMSIVGNWEREAGRFAPDLRVLVHHGSDRLSGTEFARAAKRVDLVLTTYALVARDQDSLTEVVWGRIALDEAQNVKNAATKQAKAVRAIAAPHRVALTGTPVENRLSELWSIMDFCNPGVLGSRRGFRERYAIPIERLHDDEAARQLRRATGPFILRRTKTDRTIIHDLPEKLEFEEGCNLTREQASLYQATVDDMLSRIENSEGIERKGLVLTTMLRLKQVCNHPAQLLDDGSRLAGRSGKLARLEELVDNILTAGEKVLVFTQFSTWGARLQTHLTETFATDVLFLHGGVTKRARDAMVTAFQEPDGPAVFVLSIKAGGVGLNLTAANHVVHYDRWWNPAVEDQATDRAFRIGQRRDVQVRKFVCVGTLEERIAATIARKRDLAERVVGTGEAWLTELSTRELREVLALGSDAVAE